MRLRKVRVEVQGTLRRQARFGLGFNAMAQFMAGRGYQVFMPNFRSSGGYGTAFMMRQRADWGGQDWRDVETGVDSLVKWGLADGKKLLA